MEPQIVGVAGSQNYDFLEFLQFADARLKPRFKKIIHAVRQSSAKSFPLMFVTKSALAGFYRFVNNKRVHYFEIIEAATAQTLKTLSTPKPSNQKEAGSERKKVLAIHDTSIFSFDHNAVNIEGLGRTTHGKVGFFGHFCIGLNSKTRENIGLLGLTTWTRPKTKVGRRTRKQRRNDPRTESRRWPNLVHEVQNKFDASDSPDTLIHVADREADDYASYCDFVQKDFQFVFRVQHNRSIEDEEYAKLFDSMQEAQIVCEREVSLSARKKSKNDGHKTRRVPRDKRVAKLGVSSKRVQICRSQTSGFKVPKTLELNFIRVFEIDPIDPKSAVEWILATTLPIDTVENLLEIVDIYCARWSIEEYFKAVKAGCSFEKRNLDSLHSLLNCLAIFAIHACSLYNLKILGRANPESDSTSMVSPAQIKILALSTHQKETQLKTLENAMNAIAQMGGHLKHNGLPGWQVLARGYEKLLLIEEGWKLAQNLHSRDETCSLLTQRTCVE